MTSYREGLSRTLRGSLNDDPGEYETRFDRLLAFSLTPITGSLLYRLLYDLDASAFQPCADALAKESKTKPLLAELALYERIVGNICPSCQGRREMRLESGQVITCEPCKGAGIRRAKDSDRANYLRCSIESAKRARKPLEALHDLIGTYDAKVSTIMRKRLKKD